MKTCALAGRNRASAPQPRHRGLNARTGRTRRSLGRPRATTARPVPWPGRHACHAQTVPIAVRPPTVGPMPRQQHAPGTPGRRRPRHPQRQGPTFVGAQVGSSGVAHLDKCLLDERGTATSATLNAQVRLPALQAYSARRTTLPARTTFRSWASGRQGNWITRSLPTGRTSLQSSVGAQASIDRRPPSQNRGGRKKSTPHLPAEFPENRLDGRRHRSANPPCHRHWPACACSTCRAHRLARARALVHADPGRPRRGGDQGRAPGLGEHPGGTTPAAGARPS